jgi:D-arabinose 1-dehydrogenase-like Zn-dependent alcohol dehydrogenase
MTAGQRDRQPGERQMQAVVMSDFGSAEVLQWRQLGRPEPGPGEVRIKVEAVVVNTARDVLTRAGAHVFSRFVTPPHILGGEHAGEVDAVGAGVDPGLIGDRVAASATLPCGECEFCLAGRDEACVATGLIGVHRAGAYADYAIAPAANLAAVPDDLSCADAAVLMTTGPVGLAQVRAADVGPGEVLVVPGVSGALGSMAAALAARRGARVVGLARDLARASTMPLAVDTILDAGADDLEDRLREACGPSGAHAVIDNVCVPPIWDACLGVLGVGGRVVISGQMGDGRVELYPRRFYLSNHSILGVRTGNKAMESAFWREVTAGFRLPEGLVSTFPLASAADVHRLVEAGGKVGHYVLIAGDSLS